LTSALLGGGLVPAVLVNAGGVLFVPAGTPHTAGNIGTTNTAELATYIVERGKPLLTSVPCVDIG
jgi:hypothetical protein